MTVEGWGAGRPDYHTDSIASRPQVTIKDDTQVEWLESSTYTVGGMGSTSAALYTVPTGYTLELGVGYVSARDSCIHRMRLLANGTELVGDFRFDMQGEITFSSMTGQTLEAGSILTAYLYNNDSINTEFSLNLSGILARVI